MRLHARMPELTGEGMWLNGRVETNKLIGERPTIIHFWSVSCELCKQAMPNVNRLRDEYMGRLNVVAVHMPRFDEDFDIDRITEAAEEHTVTEPIFIDHKLELTEAFDNKYVPAYYLFDRMGVLRHFQAGGGSLKMMEKRVVRLIETPKSEGDA